MEVSSPCTGASPLSIEIPDSLPENVAGYKTGNQATQVGLPGYIQERRKYGKKYETADDGYPEGDRGWYGKNKYAQSGHKYRQ